MADTLVVDDKVGQNGHNQTVNNLLDGASSQMIEARSIIQAIMIMGKNTADKATFKSN